MYVLPSIARRSPGLGAVLLPKVTAARFQTVTADPENCCEACVRLPATGGRVNLGVGLRGSGIMSLRAANGMEWAFTISGHRSGLEYDILRRARHSLWERVGGVWRNLENGVRDDDTSEVDECQRLRRSNRIFVIDRPGWVPAVLPAPASHRFQGFSHTTAHPVLSDPAATELVLRASFVEWVQARCKAEGIPWSRLELPSLPDGTKRTQYPWHSITWLIRDPAGDPTGHWVLGPRSVIRRGPLARDVLHAAPV